jgi:hypothetical protein
MKSTRKHSMILLFILHSVCINTTIQIAAMYGALLLYVEMRRRICSRVMNI